MVTENEALVARRVNPLVLNRRSSKEVPGVVPKGIANEAVPDALPAV